MQTQSLGSPSHEFYGIRTDGNGMKLSGSVFSKPTEADPHKTIVINIKYFENLIEHGRNVRKL